MVTTYKEDVRMFQKGGQGEQKRVETVAVYASQ